MVPFSTFLQGCEQIVIIMVFVNKIYTSAKLRMGEKSSPRAEHPTLTSSLAWLIH